MPGQKDPDHPPTIPITEVTWGADPDMVPTDQTSVLPERYVMRGTLGVGGMGRVLRVHDRELRRDVAMKIVHANATKAARSRFIAEAQATAQLEHPGIVPIYDLGFLPTGAAYYTMKIVRGLTLRELLEQAYRRGHPADVGAPVGLRRLVTIVYDLAQAMAYAHSRGVLHRDLKPDNVMIGDFSETIVVDWGLAKVLDIDASIDSAPLETTHELIATDRVSDDTMATVYGTITGTPAYMSPEQARGEIETFGPQVDVFALGAILYEVLTGRPPYKEASRLELLAAVLEGPPLHPAEVLDRPLPAELVELAMACLEQDPVDRPDDGSAVADAIGAWLDGARRRAQAQVLLDKADTLETELGQLREQAVHFENQAATLLEGLRLDAAVDVKRPGWHLEDRAEALRREADIQETELLAALQAALRLAPDHPEANRRLADRYHRMHQQREGAGDSDGAARLEVLLRAHDDGRHAAYLSGTGTLTLLTDPPGADAQLSRLEPIDRRLVPGPTRSLGTTPLLETELPMGSYVVRLTHPQRAPVTYPVQIGRARHWDGRPPDEQAPSPIALPRPEHIGSDDVLVPAGWFLSGGAKLPMRWAWLDALIVRRFPVTNQEYIGFLDDLVRQGHTDEALRHAPREGRGEGAHAVYGFDGRRFSLEPDHDGHLWLPDYPVVLVDWYGAQAFAAWVAQTTGLPWRLQTELEWEKAARGVDGRRLPWGDHLDPTWCCVRASHPDNPLPQVVDSYPTDVSPYGIRGAAGNVQEWCADEWLKTGPLGDGVGDGRRALRGGHWAAGTTSAFLDNRFAIQPLGRDVGLGFRVVRGYPG